MSLYERSERYIARELDKVADGQRGKRRLEIDFAAMLVGPTCGSEADRLTVLLFEANDPREIAQAMREAADRYFNDESEKTP